MRTWIGWMVVAAVLLTVTPVMAGGDLASCLETWPDSDAEPAFGAPEVDVLSETEEDGSVPWRFHLTFYLWMTGLDAESTIDGQKADVELSFSDIFDDLLEGAFSGRFEAWKGDFGLIANFDWISLGNGIEVAGPGPFGATANVDVEVEQFDAFLGGAWRFTGQPVGALPVEKGFFGDLYAGGRYTALRQEVEIRGAGGQINRDLGGRESWVEPVIGVRLGYHVTDWFTVVARGDAGGFGLGDLPDRDVIVLLGAEFRPAQWIGVRLGYQWRWFEYSTGSGQDEFGLNADYGGPLLGVTFQF